MERCSNNKENSTVALKNGTITSIFKVKKCLFDATFGKKTELSSAKIDSPMLISSPVNNVVDATFDDSPFALFKIRKKRGVVKISSPVANSPGASPIVTTPTQKRPTEDGVTEQKRNRPSSPLTQSPSVVKIAVQKSILNPNLIGDFSVPCSLSTIKGKHPDLKSISPETVAGIMRGYQSFGYTLIDCRYPYEFNGGHIKTALNIFNKDEIEKELFPVSVMKEKSTKQNVLIFYCEFSSERGPSMLRFLRSRDRELNKDFYPYLYYPELYLMEGGYKAFFSCYKLKWLKNIAIDIINPLLCCYCCDDEDDDDFPYWMFQQNPFFTQNQQYPKNVLGPCPNNFEAMTPRGVKIVIHRHNH